MFSIYSSKQVLNLDNQSLDLGGRLHKYTCLVIIKNISHTGKYNVRLMKEDLQ